MKSSTVYSCLVDEHIRTIYIFQSFGLPSTDRRLDKVETPTFGLVPSVHVTELEPWKIVLRRSSHNVDQK